MLATPSAPLPWEALESGVQPHRGRRVQGAWRRWKHMETSVSSQPPQGMHWKEEVFGAQEPNLHRLSHV